MFPLVSEVWVSCVAWQRTQKGPRIGTSFVLAISFEIPLVWFSSAGDGTVSSGFDEAEELRKEHCTPQANTVQGPSAGSEHKLGNLAEAGAMVSA